MVQTIEIELRHLYEIIKNCILDAHYLNKVKIELFFFFFFFF